MLSVLVIVEYVLFFVLKNSGATLTSLFNLFIFVSVIYLMLIDKGVNAYVSYTRMSALLHYCVA